jgi:hypothetical protein
VKTKTGNTLYNVPFNNLSGVIEMSVFYLDTTEDLKWLQDVHKIPNATDYKAALIYGNEDSPSKVELYARDHYQCPPAVFEPNQDGDLVCTQVGEPVSLVI